MVFPASSEHMRGRFDFDVPRFRVVSPNPGPRIRLESPQSQPEDEVSHKRASINPRAHAAATSCKEDRRFASRNSVAGVEYLTQSEIRVGSKAVVEEISFNCRPNYARAKDVAKFDAAEETGVIVRMDLDSIGGGNVELLGQASGATTVLKNIGPHIDCPVKTSSVKFRRRWGKLIVCYSFPASDRKGR